MLLVNDLQGNQGRCVSVLTKYRSAQLSPRTAEAWLIQGRGKWPRRPRLVSTYADKSLASSTWRGLAERSHVDELKGPSQRKRLLYHSRGRWNSVYHHTGVREVTEQEETHFLSRWAKQKPPNSRVPAAWPSGRRRWPPPPPPRDRPDALPASWCTDRLNSDLWYGEPIFWRTNISVFGLSQVPSEIAEGRWGLNPSLQLLTREWQRWDPPTSLFRSSGVIHVYISSAPHMIVRCWVKIEASYISDV